MASTINADDGVISGIAGVKTTADSTGALNIQTNGTTAISISATQAVSLTNSPTFTGGTANGVLFLNASKVATSGTALTYNGTALTSSASSAISGIFNRDTSSGATLQIQVVGNSVGTLGSDTGGNGRFDLAAVTSMQLRAAGASGYISFDANNTEQMRLTSTGLGIGMTPNNILDITQNQNSSATSKILNNSAGAGARVDIIATNGTAQSQLTTFGTGFSTTSIFRANGTLVYATGAGGLTLSTDTAQPIYFATNQTERMRLDSSGNLGIGTTSPGSKLAVAGGLQVNTSGTIANFTASGSSSNATVQIQADNGAGYNARLYFECPGSNSGGFTYERSTSRLYAYSQSEFSGPYVTATGTSWTTGSDQRLKKNIQSIEYGLNAVMALLPKKYVYQNNEEKQCFGLIAQDVFSVIPEIVDVPKDADEMMGIEYQSVIPVLVKAIQEQQAIITQLTARITALEGT